MITNEGKKGARRQAALDAEGKRIGWECGMDGYLAGWAGNNRKTQFWIGASFFLVLCPLVVQAASNLLKGLDMGSYTGFASFTVVVLLLVFLMVTLRPRARRGRLFMYEDGIVEARHRKPRLAVLRYADLAAMSVKVVRGYDGDYLESCVLRDHAGSELAVHSWLYGGRACEEVHSGAGHAIASRIVGPLTRRLDDGLSVTIGSVTVDGAGITVLGRKAWTVPWEQARGVYIRLWGQRLTINTAREGSRSAELDSQPNSFLVRHVIAHAARRAGVDVSAE
jgi:hypothetical protein